MGNKTQKSSEIIPEQGISLKHFELEYIIGKGALGKVWRVKGKRNNETFAMKIMQKHTVIMKRSIQSILNERMLLRSIKHPFIVNMQFCFQDRRSLYLIMDFMGGGDLRKHIKEFRTFTEAQTKFFVACIFTGVEYLHVNRIVHRDLKPENIVFDQRGYLRITDFGIAKKIDWKGDTSGTPGYMAPEVMCGKPHSYAADYYALGILTFELMMGGRPYTGKNRHEIKDKILCRQVQLKRKNIPEGWTVEAADFVNKLIQRNPMCRLGYNGPHEVKNHAWLRDFPWKSLFEKKIKPPFKPQNSEYSFSNDFEENLAEDNRIASFYQVFEEYYFDSRETSNKHSKTLTFNRNITSKSIN